MTAPLSLRTASLATLFVALAASAQEAPLTTAAAVRALSPAQAGREIPVRLRGVVTLFSNSAAVFFLQDATGGVCISGPRDKSVRGDFKVGAEVEVEGVTAAGRPLPFVTATKKEPLHITVVGEAALPDPPSVPLAQLARPEHQGVRVEVGGVVRSVRKEPFGNAAQETLLLTLAEERDRITVALPGRSPGALPTQLVGASVRVRGVFSGLALERQPALSNRLLINLVRDITIAQPAPPPFAGDARPVAAVRASADEAGPDERVRIVGRVTVPIPGKGMFVEDQTGAMFIEASPIAATGEAVEVAGFPALREGAPTLEDAIWRPTGPATPLEAPLITPEAALSGDYDGRLVQIEALLLTLSSAGDGPTLVLQSGSRVFLARCANPRLRLPPLGGSSWLRVTGVCVNPPAQQLRETGAGGAASFHLLLPGPSAIEIGAAPRWWTFRRIMVALAALGALAFAAIAWATTLRRRVARQTEQIREHLAREAVVEERLRIAGELHDSVQQDLLGITMQIKATERLLETAPEKARTALNLASAMVRHSQAETHRAVWDLRDSADEHADLVNALHAMVAGVNTDDGARVTLAFSGTRRDLPPAIETQVLRVAQEAVSNALKHAEATRIELELRFSPERLCLSIRDDGRGFEADQVPSAASGHFGLAGMHERAVKLGADLRFTSRPGAGTTVQLDVPVPAPEAAPAPVRTQSALRLIARPSTS